MSVFNPLLFKKTKIVRDDSLPVDNSGDTQNLNPQDGICNRSALFHYLDPATAPTIPKFHRVETVNGNAKKWTLSFWIKRGSFRTDLVDSGIGFFDRHKDITPIISSCQQFSLLDRRRNAFQVAFDDNQDLRIQAYDNEGNQILNLRNPETHELDQDSSDINDERYLDNIDTDYTSDSYSYNIFDDCSTWYHISIHVDTTATEPTDRVCVYVGGRKLNFVNTVTPADLYHGGSLFPEQNADLYFSKESSRIELGIPSGRVLSNNLIDDPDNYRADAGDDAPAGSRYNTNFYLTNLIYVDTLQPYDAFCYFDSDNRWQPREITAEIINRYFFTPNSWHLSFKDPDILGADYSGNNKHFEANDMVAKTVKEAPLNTSDSGMYLQWNQNEMDYEENRSRHLIQLEEGNTKVRMLPNPDETAGEYDCITVYGDQYISRGKYFIDLIVQGVTGPVAPIMVGISEVSSFSMPRQSEPVGRTGGFGVELNGYFNTDTGDVRSRVIAPTPYAELTSFDTYHDRTIGETWISIDSDMTMNTGGGENRISFYIDLDFNKENGYEDDPIFYLITGDSGEHVISTHAEGVAQGMDTTTILDGDGDLSNLWSYKIIRPSKTNPDPDKSIKKERYYTVAVTFAGSSEIERSVKFVNHNVVNPVNHITGMALPELNSNNIAAAHSNKILKPEEHFQAYKYQPYYTNWWNRKVVVWNTHFLWNQIYGDRGRGRYAVKWDLPIDDVLTPFPNWWTREDYATISYYTDTDGDTAENYLSATAEGRDNSELTINENIVAHINFAPSLIQIHSNEYDTPWLVQEASEMLAGDNTHEVYYDQPNVVRDAITNRNVMIKNLDTERYNNYFSTVLDIHTSKVRKSGSEYELQQHWSGIRNDRIGLKWGRHKTDGDTEFYLTDNMLSFAHDTEGEVRANSRGWRGGGDSGNDFENVNINSVQNKSYNAYLWNGGDQITESVAGEGNQKTRYLSSRSAGMSFTYIQVNTNEMDEARYASSLRGVFSPAEPFLIPHHLDQEPEFFYYKSPSKDSHWMCYHKDAVGLNLQAPKFLMMDQSLEAFSDFRIAQKHLDARYERGYVHETSGENEDGEETRVYRYRDNAVETAINAMGNYGTNFLGDTNDTFNSTAFPDENHITIKNFCATYGPRADMASDVYMDPTRGLARFPIDAGFLYPDVSYNSTRSAFEFMPFIHGEFVFLHAFHSVPQFSHFTSYIGTATTNFIWTGFMPAYVMIKNIDTYNHWVVFSSLDAMNNVVSRGNYMNVEGTPTYSAGAIELFHNGFACISTIEGKINLKGEKYIVCAWAKEPHMNNGAGSPDFVENYSARPNFSMELDVYDGG